MEELSVHTSADQNDTVMPALSRRSLLAGASALGGMALTSASVQAAIQTKDYSKLPPYGNNTLPAGVKARLIPNINGITVNIIEAGTPGRPLVLMLHGFPNLAYAYRKVMPALAAAGYYAVAPDCRGFGRTLGWDNSWDADPTPFGMLNMVRDQVALVAALGYHQAHMMVGHDQGANMATYGALIRPDLFPRLILLGGGGNDGDAWPFNIANGAPMPHPDYTNEDLDAAYAKLNPPRVDYQRYWATKQADEDMKHLPAGMTMTSFFRAFTYMKSHDFPGNQHLEQHRLKVVHTAQEAAAQNAQIPEYYVMRRGKGMPATVAAFAPPKSYEDTCKWLTPAECAVYGQEYTLSGWTGPLHEYRHRRNNAFPQTRAEHMTFSGQPISVPSMIIAGNQDWGANRRPGGPQTMSDGKGFTKFKGLHMVEGAGHWVHEEQPEQVSQLMLKFLHDNA